MDKIKGTKNSHIQVPRFILEGFSTPETICNDKGFPVRQNKIWRLDMDLNTEQLDIKDCNVEQGYYEDWAEQKLSVYETKMGNVKKKFVDYKRALDNGIENEIQLSDEDINAIIDHYKLCLLRSPDLCEQIERTSTLMELLSSSVPNAVIAFSTDTDIQNILDEIFVKFNSVRLLVNQSDVHFVLPQQYAFGYNTGYTSAFFTPIMPNLALMLSTEQESGIIKLSDDLLFNAINEYGIKSEFATNNCAIYAKTEDDIKRYIPFIKQHCKI